MIDDPFLAQLVAKARSTAPPTGLPQQEPVHPAIAAMPDDQLDSALKQLLSQHEGKFSNFNLQEVPRPQSNNEPDVGGRFFLSGLVHGVNRGVGGGKDETSHLRQMLLAEQIRKAQAGNTARAGAATSAPGASPKPEKVDPYEADKHAWWKARIGATEASGRASDALAQRRGRPDAPRTGGNGSRAGSGTSKSELAARYRAALARATESAKAIGAKEMWSKEETAAAVSRQHARIAAEYQALLKGTPMPDETPGANVSGRRHAPDPLGIR